MATLKFGDIKSKTYNLGPRGTAQGAVLFPLIFNLAMRGLAGALRAGPRVEHATYADDFTPWCRTGSDGEIEEHLQRAAVNVDCFARECALHCAPKKSKLYGSSESEEEVMRAYRHKDRGNGCAEARGCADIGAAHSASQREQANPGQTGHHDTQVCGMLRRIRNKKHWIKKEEALQLVQAFIISRLTYGTPYLQLNKTDRQRLRVFIRRAYKNALRLPERTATEGLLKLGVPNSIEELHEVQLISQLRRLEGTTNCRWLLDKFEMSVPGGSREGEETGARWITK
ncbi:hypothetical protein HPB47_020001 [Ixodes persulcatus]|uniref:Uncharacterized protein n=1 Tax=Ixodes persulcatus TaxID=34615 RepID=A0AC60QHK0_IXOPE|nr:hypothetical protein HPB47_020001 [Ixodes persulcatus]